jgi:hypothetical protein
MRVQVPVAFADATWEHVLLGPMSTTGASLDVGSLLGELPVAVLVN